MNGKSSMIALAILLMVQVAPWTYADDAASTPARLQRHAFHVSSTGNDSANGSTATPWRTLQHAADTVHAGDAVNVKPGQYAGFVMGWDAPQNGTAASPIIFQAQPGVVITSRNNKTEDAIDLEGSSYITIQGFKITNDGSIDRAGIRAVQGNHLIIEDNNIDGMGTWGIYTSHCDDLLIKNNKASHSKKQHGIYVSNSAQRPVVIGNTLWSNADCGLHMNGDASQGGRGIIAKALVADNIIYDNGTIGGSGINCDGVQNSVIQNNLLYNNHASGISLYRIDGGGGSTGNLVVNNTIIMAADSRWAINIKNVSTANIVYNNILYNKNHNHGSINIAEDSRAGFVSDYNIVDDRFSPNDDDVVALSRWRQDMAMDQHSLVATPDQLFVNPGKNDLRLLPAGPAVGSGRQTPAPLEDSATKYETTTPKKIDAWDIGAHPPISAIPASAAMIHLSLFDHHGIALMSALAMLGCALGVWLPFQNRGLHRWLVPYCLQSSRRRPPAAGQKIHLLLCIADHYEPHNGGVPDERADARVASWLERYPALFANFHDADGRPPRHTFFYPVEQYNRGHVESISQLCRSGFGEIEIHFHHDNDTAENLRQTLLHAKALLMDRHGQLARRKSTGEIVYGFVHGDWALANSRSDGQCCGINNELDILRKTGCYADFTMPSAPSETQTRKINSIYYATGDQHKPKSHDTGMDAGTGTSSKIDLLLIQGPLLLNWRNRKAGLLPRIENACIQVNQAPSMQRLDLWLRARIQVPTRPDWFFVKLHTHGAPEDNQAVLLGDPMVKFHQALAQRAHQDVNFHYHYVTAREMYNLAKAAEAGWKGTVEDARDFELVWNQEEPAELINAPSRS